ncbi:MAG: acyltransferase family protein [Butyrivibrio sp.]|nr:acyltransferase family protein [Butyrivibrio sp.]
MTAISRKSRRDNYFLYAVRCIAALFVIVIHTRFPGKAGEILDALARFAVPFFFALSGRFLLDIEDKAPVDIRKKAGNSLKKILAVTAKVYNC